MIAHWHLLIRPDDARFGVEFEDAAGEFDQWWFRDHEQLRQVILHLIDHLSDNRPDIEEADRG
jgi:hypothetical protein